MWHDDVVGRETTTAGEKTLEQGQRGCDVHGVVRSSRLEGTGMRAAARVLSWAARVPLTPCGGQRAIAVLERMVTAALAPRGHAMLIGVLTILALTGARARVVRPVVHQRLRPQVLAARRVLRQPVERMVAVGDSITKGDWDVDEAGGWGRNDTKSSEKGIATWRFRVTRW